MPFVYILKMKDSTHYCGIARNVLKRIIQHQKGRSKTTRNKRPLVIRYVKEVPTIFHARTMEKLIKAQGVTRWMIKNSGRIDNLASIVIRTTANSQQPTA